MMKKNKVIFDTNIWISFLIGKRLNKISDYISNADFLVTGDKDLLELKKFKTAQILTAEEFEKQF